MNIVLKIPKYEKRFKKLIPHNDSYNRKPQFSNKIFKYFITNCQMQQSQFFKIIKYTVVK